MVSDFDAIYQEYGKTVYCFLLSLSRDETLSEELTQETMFRAIMNISSFRGDSKISVWLCQIAKNLYLEWMKKNKRIVPIDESIDPVSYTHLDVYKRQTCSSSSIFKPRLMARL